MELPSDYKILVKNKVEAQLHFTFSKCDLVNILSFIARNEDNLSRCELFCEEITFDEHKYHTSEYYKGEEIVPENQALTVFEEG